MPLYRTGLQAARSSSYAEAGAAHSSIGLDRGKSSSLHFPTMKTALTTLALSALALACVDARPTYPARLPNGDNVEGVTALGHENKVGGGALNVFGEAFSTAGTKWTVELCQADSDGDGQTNGEELGDPCCTWTVGGTPSYTSGLSHPGDATSKADPTLWADVKCAGTSASASNSTSSSSGSSEAPTAGSTPSSTTSTPSSTTSAPSTTTTPAPTQSSAASTSVAIAAGVAAGVAALAQW